MRKQNYTVNDITKITGITRRTLHYYGEIGLLKATSLSPHGYRLYDMSDLEKLQIILFLKEINLPLKDISAILQLSKQEQNKILEHHYEILSRKKQKLENMMSNLERYLSGEDMFDLDIFQNTTVLPLKEQYKREGKFAYGETQKYKEYEKNIDQLTTEEKDRLLASFDERMKELFKLFAVHIKESPASARVQLIVKQWADSFKGFFVCDNQILKCIAKAYKFDNRFRKYINQFSDEDLSDFIYKAIIFYCGEE
ncbi:MAG: MerR family transcriptional regulator [Clostridium sp. SCN 57-10]|nr:MAG: MerR family transcriptional regulator [Clostridium sp. SCN 57-10]